MKKQSLYLEFMFVILDYFKTVNRKYFIFEILFPFIIGIFVFYSLCSTGDYALTADFNSYITNLMGILIGFSITVITILSTGNSPNLNKIRITDSEFSSGGKKLTIYQVLLSNYSYSVIVEVFVLITLLIYPFIDQVFDFSATLKVFGFSWVAFTSFHILFLTIRNVTNLYFILFKSRNED